jgi:hypothetical protein
MKKKTKTEGSSVNGPQPISLRSQAEPAKARPTGGV